MTEAERLRAQAGRCLELARRVSDEASAEVLTRLATKNYAEADNLERYVSRRKS